MNISDSTYVSEVDSFLYTPARQLVTDISTSDVEMFPYSLTNQNKQYVEQTYNELTTHLREGKPTGSYLFHEDWLLLVILFVIGVYSLINYYMGKMTGDVLSFLSFRQVADSEESNDNGFSSLNISWRGFFVFMASVTSLALYLYCCFTYYDVFRLFPKQLSNHIWWIAVCFGSVIIAFAFRFFICTITGGISGQKKLFSEYVDTVYNGYKFIAIILLFLSIFIIYAHSIPVKVLLFFSFVVIGIVVIIRYIKLFLFFIINNVSISYLFLYLCALEIIPILIFIKYVGTIA